MTPTTRNFAFHQGSTDAIALAWKRDGVAVDLTGYSARMQLRYSASDATAVTEFSTVNGKIVLAAGGSITVHLDAPLVINAGEYLHIIVKMPLGTATASQVIRGVVGVNGFFE